MQARQPLPSRILLPVYQRAGQTMHRLMLTVLLTLTFCASASPVAFPLMDHGSWGPIAGQQDVETSTSAVKLGHGSHWM